MKIFGYKFFEKNNPTITQQAIPYLARRARINEAIKGQVDQGITNFLTQTRGLPHPYKMNELNNLYLKIPIVHGAINKIVDFTVGPGFRIKTEDERVNTILQAFMKELDFDNLLRTIVRDVLVYGNAYLEIVSDTKSITQLIPRSPETMYVKRDEKGQLLGYAQIVNKTMTPIEFKTSEIAHFKNTKTGDNAYGTSTIYPLLQTLYDKLQLERDLVLITTRKANAPYDVTVGDETNPNPAQADINAIKQDFEDLRNDQEWVHGPSIKIEALGFKDKAMDLKPYLDYYENQIVFGLEVPIVLLGKGNVPEGLAMAQKEAFERKIVSIQLAIESVLENDLFPRVIESQGLPLTDIEFEWKEPDPEQQLEEVKTITELIKAGSFGSLSPDFLAALQQRLGKLLSLENDEKEGEFDAPQPKMPGQDRGRPLLQYTPHVQENIKTLYDAPLKEFIGFNYGDYIKEIITFIESKDFIKREYKGFKYVPGTSQQDWEEIVIKYNLRENLTKKQVETLRDVLIEGFEQGKSVNQIRSAILSNVKPKDLKVNIPEVRDAEGEILRQSYTLHVSKEQRASILSRTETIRASNQGTLTHYENLGVKEVQWLAALDARVCPYCEDNDGETFTLEQANELIPAHVDCRCSWLAIKE